MIARALYRFDEAVERLGTDEETLKQAIALGRFSVFLQFLGHYGYAIWGSDDDELPSTKSDPYCEWRRWREEPDENGHACYWINGWFRVETGAARRAGRIGSFDYRLRVTPSSAPLDFFPWDLGFIISLAPETLIDTAWFLASEVDAITNAKAMVANKWPWGDHQTEALQHLEAAAVEWWSTYEAGIAAPTNDEVAAWLVKERGASQRLADAIASILRADDVKDGPRPKK